jgi:hypothetical protein
LLLIALSLAFLLPLCPSYGTATVTKMTAMVTRRRREEDSEKEAEKRETDER